MTVTRADAAAARSKAVRQQSHRPSQRRYAGDSDATRHARGGQVEIVRAQPDAEASLLQVRGYASVTEQPYEMWDMFGPYTEVVSADAFLVTLARTPDVQLNYQHGKVGTMMARTTVTDGEGSLRLTSDGTGLLAEANPLMSLSTTQDMVALMNAGLLTEMSFAFSITRGAWNADYTEYRIHEVDIHRGDVSLVNYGANPATSVDVIRSTDDVELSPTGITRSAHARIDATLALLRSSRA